MSHTHHPDGQGPTCRFKTKKECDKNYSLHQQAVKAEYEALIERRRQERREVREAAFQAFMEKEERRKSEGGSPV